jgi:hypothetical protein
MLCMSTQEPLVFVPIHVLTLLTANEGRSFTGVLGRGCDMGQGIVALASKQRATLA